MMTGFYIVAHEIKVRLFPHSPALFALVFPIFYIRLNDDMIIGMTSVSHMLVIYN